MSYRPVDALRFVRRAVEAGIADLPVAGLMVVAVSGGPDSIALARAVAALPRRAAAVIVDHGLQDRSDRIAAEAAHACAGLGLAPVIVERVTVIARGTGPEAAARDARRAALESAADRLGASAILLGHTRDDQAETVLLRLARGSGARSLSAMAPVSGRWRRPLLDVPRAVVRESVADLATWEDPHNADPAYARVRVREEAMPALVEALGADVVAGLARSARLLRDDADALDAQASAALGAVTGDDGTLSVEALAALPRAVRTRVIRRAALAAGCSAAALTSDHVERLDALVTDWHGQGAVDLPGGIAGERRYARLALLRADPVAERRRREGKE